MKLFMSNLHVFPHPFLSPLSQPLRRYQDLWAERQLKIRMAQCPASALDTGPIVCINMRSKSQSWSEW
jgi:exoribonuclease R